MNHIRSERTRLVGHEIPRIQTQALRYCCVCRRPKGLHYWAGLKACPTFAERDIAGGIESRQLIVCAA